MDGINQLFQELGFPNWESRVQIEKEKVVSIDLSNLGLKEIPSLLAHYSSIKEINVSKNRIETIDHWLNSLTNLKILDLRENLITDLSLDTVQHIDTVFLEGNPLPERILQNLHYLRYREKYLDRLFQENSKRFHSSSEILRDFFTSLDRAYPYPFSYSQLYTLKTCKLKWFFDYFLDFRRFEIGEPSKDMIYGSEFHDYVQHNLRIVSVQPFQVFISKEKYEQEIRFIEDFINSWGDYSFQKRVQNIIVEKYVEAPAEQIIINGLQTWIKRIGIIDMVWELVDGSVFIWDIKTSQSTNSKHRHLQQTYFYKYILEKLGYTVDGVGIIYPKAKTFIARFTRAIPKEDPRMKRLQVRSVKSLEQNILKHLEKVLAVDIQADPSYFTCSYCNYASIAMQKCISMPRGIEFMKQVKSRDDILKLFSES